MYYKCLPGILALVCASTVAASVEFHKVSSDGSMDYTTIEAAIDAASDGDVVEIYPGFYYEALTIWGKSLLLQGKPDPETGERPILLGTSENKPILKIGGEESYYTRVFDCDFMGGSAGWGGAVVIVGTSVYFKDCTFSYNMSTVFGGAVELVESPESRFVRCVFFNNRSKISGGAVLLFRSPTVFYCCLFTDNDADKDGGAIFVFPVGGPETFPTLTNCNFVGNKAHRGWFDDILGIWFERGWTNFAESKFDGDDDGIPDELEPQMLDANGDGEIDGYDFMRSMGIIGGLGIFNPGDRDDDGDIDGDDFTLMLKDVWYVQE